VTSVTLQAERDDKIATTKNAVIPCELFQVYICEQFSEGFEGPRWISVGQY